MSRLFLQVVKERLDSCDKLVVNAFDNLCWIVCHLDVGFELSVLKEVSFCCAESDYRDAEI